MTNNCRASVILMHNNGCLSLSISLLNLSCRMRNERVTRMSRRYHQSIACSCCCLSVCQLSDFVPLATQHVFCRKTDTRHTTTTNYTNSSISIHSLLHFCRQSHQGYEISYYGNNFCGRQINDIFSLDMQCVNCRQCLVWKTQNFLLSVTTLF